MFYFLLLGNSDGVLLCNPSCTVVSVYAVQSFNLREAKVGQSSILPGSKISNALACER